MVESRAPVSPCSGSSVFSTAATAPPPAAADAATTLYGAVLLSHDNCDRNRVTPDNLGIIGTRTQGQTWRVTMATKSSFLISAGSMKSWDQFGCQFLGGCFISLIATLCPSLKISQVNDTQKMCSHLQKPSMVFVNTCTVQIDLFVLFLQKVATSERLYQQILH